MEWSRRDVLAGLGVGAAAVLATALGCGAAGTGARKSTVTELKGDDVRAWLRRAVEQLRGEYPVASARAVIAHRITAAIDLRGRGVVRARRAAVVIRVEDAAGRGVERATGELSAAAVVALVAGLRRTTTSATAARRGIELGGPVKHAPVGGPLVEHTDAAWLERVDQLAARGEAASSSRVVYRGAWHDVDDVAIWHVGSGPDGGFDREQHLVRSRSGLVLMAWNGAVPMVGQAERGAVGGPDQIALTDADIARAARGALELTTPGTMPSGAATVLLMPSVVARLADVAIAPVLTTDAWRRVDLGARVQGGATIGAPAITIATAPDPGHYGGYHFDGEGVTGVSAALIAGGVIRGPVGDRRGAAATAGAIAGAGLRPGHTGAVAPAIGHLAWSPGPEKLEVDQLIERVDDGWIVDDAGAAHVDPVAWTATIEVARARRVKSGAETGHVYTGVELTARVPELLAGATRLSSALETFVSRGGDAADAAWRSLEVPALISRAMLTPRRPV